MRILTITPTYWPEGSGGTLATHLIIKLLSEIDGLQLTVLTGTINPEKVASSNVNYIIDPFLKNIENRYPFPLLAEKRYAKIIEKHDIVYVVYAYTLIPIAKKLGKKVIVHLHDYKIISPSSSILITSSGDLTFTKLLKESFMIKHLEFKNLKNTILNLGDTVRTIFLKNWIQDVDTIIAVSKRHAELLTQIIPDVKSKMRIIYNPPPPIPNIFKTPDPEPTFLYVGGESYLKGFHILLDAIIRFLRKGGKAKFIFTNKYTQETMLYIDMINKLYGSIIQLTGRTSYSELMEMYKKSWALLFPSIWEEPLPYAIIESLMTKTIPIASQVGGVLEITKRSCMEKYIFKPNNAEELNERIIGIASMGYKDILEIQEKYFECFHNLRSSLFNENKILKQLLDAMSD